MSTEFQNNDKDTPQPSNFSDLKSKRDEITQEIRKQKREQILNQDRDRILANEQEMEEEYDLVDSVEDQDEEDQLLEEMEKQWLEETFSLDDFPDLLNAATTEDKFRQLYGLIGLNKIINEGNIQSIMDSDLVPILINLLSKDENPHLHKQAIKLIQKISTGTTEQVQIIVDKGVIDCLFKLLKCESDDDLQLILFTIGNIAADNVHFRDMILRNSGLDPILEVVNRFVNPVLIEAGAGAISSLCRGNPLPTIELVEKAAPTLSTIFQREQNIDVIIDMAWALSSIFPRSKTESTKKSIKEIIPDIRHYFDHNERLGVPCLRIIGNLLVSVEDKNHVKYSSPDFIPRVFKMLQSQSLAIRRETCFLLSNITAGSPWDIDLILNNPYYVDMLIRVAKSDVPQVVVEAAFVLANAMKNINANKISEVLELGVLDCFIHLLDTDVELIRLVVLDGMIDLLNRGDILANQSNTENEPLVVLNVKGGLKKLHDLQQADISIDVSCRISKIVETFFPQSECESEETDYGQIE